MSESRKNHFTVDGGQAKEEDVSTYMPIPEADTELRTSKSNISKSKEKVSPDGAEEKLLQKEDEAKVVPRVDMDAKYVVESYTNGDAKIELDASKNQFTGITKEELMKYVDDPFWVRLRWFMFIMFWALWLFMLAAAIVIIVHAPKCPPPEPKTWSQRGPLVDATHLDIMNDPPSIDSLSEANIQGVFVQACKMAYEDKPSCMDSFKEYATKAKDKGIKIIVELTANFVNTTHMWFTASENRTPPYEDYFIWANGTVDTPPTNWVSLQDDVAWTLSKTRNQYYLHQLEDNVADLNFRNDKVQEELDKEIKLWMDAGASGIRFRFARLLIVNKELKDEVMVENPHDYTHTDYGFYKHSMTSDQPELYALLNRTSEVVKSRGKDNGVEETVFTLKEEGVPNDSELISLALRPPSTRTVDPDDREARHLLADIKRRLAAWPLLQLLPPRDNAEELVALSIVLPASPVFDIRQIYKNESQNVVSEAMRHLSPLRQNAVIEHGKWELAVISAIEDNTTHVLACARWKEGQNVGYLVIYNPTNRDAVVNVGGSVMIVPPSLTILHVSDRVKLRDEYKDSGTVTSDKVLVPAYSSVLFSFAPNKNES